MKYLRHIVLFSGILVIVAFFTRISRHALYDGYFSKIEELNTRNSQEWGAFKINLPAETENFLEVNLIKLHDFSDYCRLDFFYGQCILSPSNSSESSIYYQIFNFWIKLSLVRQLPGFSQAP
jgi:hypothetical protein